MIVWGRDLLNDLGDTNNMQQYAYDIVAAKKDTMADKHA